METPSGEPLGKVRQGQYCCIPEYKIIDAQGNQILHVQGTSIGFFHNVKSVHRYHSKITLKVLVS